MLVLTRRVGEQIMIDNGLIQIKILRRRKGQIALGIQAPPHMTVDREEIYNKKMNKLEKNEPFTNENPTV